MSHIVIFKNRRLANPYIGDSAGRRLTVAYFQQGSRMNGKATLITQGTQLSLRRAPRRVKTLVDDGGVSVFDSEEL